MTWWRLLSKQLGWPPLTSKWTDTYTRYMQPLCTNFRRYRERQRQTYRQTDSQGAMRNAALLNVTTDPSKANVNVNCSHMIMCKM